MVQSCVHVGEKSTESTGVVQSCVHVGETIY